MQLLESSDPRLRGCEEVAAVARLLDGLPVIGDQRAVRDRMRAFVGSHPDALRRSCVDGHLTGSALVAEAAGDRVLLLFHAKLRRWMQPGGHADGEANLAAVALREATEETGIEGLRVDPDPIDLDIHLIPARAGEPAHLHLDVRFLVVAPRGARPTGNHESEALGWYPPDALGGCDLDTSTLRLIEVGVARVRAGAAS